MKKVIPFSLALVFGILFYLPSVSAQCKGCAHANPSMVFSSTKNKITMSGPPDGKGKPVEYQIFTQARDGSWKFETSGKIEKPGAKDSYSYYKPVQLMALIYCETPFGNIVEFSSAKVPPPTASQQLAPPTKN